MSQYLKTNQKQYRQFHSASKGFTTSLLCRRSTHKLAQEETNILTNCINSPLFYRNQSDEYNQTKKDQRRKLLSYPSTFPLQSLSAGKFPSLLHLDNQLFLTIRKDKFIFIVVNPENQKSNLKELKKGFVEAMLKIMRLNKSQLFNKFGKSSPFANPEVKEKEEPSKKSESAFEAEFSGSTSFEIDFQDIVGMEYQSSLAKQPSRVVFEVKSMKKLWFPKLKYLFKHYFKNDKVPLSPEEDTYIPILNKERNRILLPRAFPFNTPKNNPILPSSDQYLIHSLFMSEPQNDYEPTCQYFNNLTVAAYFEDPLIPFALKEIMNSKRNARLLDLYKSSIPSWCIFMASYGLFYRYWMRLSLRFIMLFLSLSTMMFGLYDLYTHVPMIKDYLETHLSFLGNQFFLRISIVITFFSTKLEYILQLLLGSEILQLFFCFFNIIWRAISEVASYFGIIILFIGKLISFFWYLIKELGSKAQTIGKPIYNFISSGFIIVKSIIIALFDLLAGLLRIIFLLPKILLQIVRGIGKLVITSGTSVHRMVGRGRSVNQNIVTHSVDIKASLSFMSKKIIIGFKAILMFFLEILQNIMFHQHTLILYGKNSFTNLKQHSKEAISTLLFNDQALKEVLKTIIILSLAFVFTRTIGNILQAWKVVYSYDFLLVYLIL